jgi:hypothetical protein
MSISPAITADLLLSLRRQFGADCVDDASQAQSRYGADTGAGRTDLLGALRLSQAAQISTALAMLNPLGVPVHPISSGHNWGYGTARPASDGCLLLDLSGMKRILDFDAELGVVSVEPGVTQQDLADFLDQGRHPFLVPVTGAGPSCSLLSNALERGYGVTPISDHFAAVTDLEAVLPDGSLYRSMLAEAGGSDLARLYRWGIGAYTHGLFTQSGLGVVTRVSILLARRPEGTEVCLFSLRDDSLLEPAVAAVRGLMQRLPSTIGGINLMNRHRVLAMSAPYPFERLGPQGVLPPEVIAALGQEYQILPWTGFCTLYGSTAVLRGAREEIRRALRGLASRLMFVSPRRADQLARLAKLLPGRMGSSLRRAAGTLRQSLQLVAGRPNETALPLAYWRNPRPQPEGVARNPARDGCGLLWYAPLVPMRGSDARRFAEFVFRTTQQYGMEPLITFTTLNQAVFDSTIPLVFDRQDDGAAARAQACYEALLSGGRELGFFPYRVGVDAMAQLRDLAPQACAFQQRLRAGIGAEHLIAPGRYS